MRFIICLLLAILSLGLSILCFFVLLASCGGHPPTFAIGVWILPLSLLGSTIFFYLSLFFWKAGRHQASGLLKKEASVLPRKVFIFFSSFVVGTIALILLKLLIIELTLETTLPDWTAYVFRALSIAIAILVGVAIYRRLAKINV